MTINSDFSVSPLDNIFGVVTGSVAGIQFPSYEGIMVRFKARSTNVGSFFIGNGANNCVYELDAGDDTGWVATNYLNLFWYRSPSGSLDILNYWMQDE